MEKEEEDNLEEQVENLTGLQLWVAMIHCAIQHLEVAIEAYEQRDAGLLNTHAKQAHILIKELSNNTQIFTINYKVRGANVGLKSMLVGIEKTLRKHHIKRLALGLHHLKSIQSYWENLDESRPGEISGAEKN